MLDKQEQEDLVGIENLLLQGHIVEARLNAARKASLSDVFENIDCEEARSFGVITTPEEAGILKTKMGLEHITLGL